MPNKVYHSKESDEWTTPKALLKHLNIRFDLDAAATKENAVCENFLDNALNQQWKGDSVWCNPPYSLVDEFVNRALNQLPNYTIACLLVPVRTGRNWWAKLHNCPYACCTLYQGRIYFGGTKGKAGAPFDSCLWWLCNNGEFKYKYSVEKLLVRDRKDYE